jgi:hypothetical protein
MIELALLAFVNRLLNWGLAPIIITRTIAADAQTLHRVLCDPLNQWHLAAAFSDVVGLQPAGDRYDGQLRLPLGTHLRASVQVKPSRKARLLTTQVRLGPRTVAWVTWILTPSRGTTDVDVAVQPESRSLLTRLVLLLGTRRWITRRLEIALATLAKTSAHAAEDLVAAPAPELTLMPDAGPPSDPPLPARPVAIHR